ncbi:MAG: signal recognition particle protein [Planctomycetes bacterium]|nr:signal recognition particle protein [Planctomycetota bacterium]MCA8936907.1 signal recognition particle protein [Planctomycetota bacterium]
MFDNISSRFTDLWRKMSGSDTISEENVKDAVRAIRTALLEADVSLKVAKNFTENVREKALGAEVLQGVRPGEQFIKIVHDELIRMMNEPGVVDEQGRAKIKFRSDRPTVILMAGLQGAGKTTTCGKLALYLKQKYKKNPMLVAADLQRPAAVDQLEVVGKGIGMPVFADRNSTPPEVCERAVAEAKKKGHDVVILDTAGRLHVDDDLMKEVQEIARRAQPDEVFFVCDGMTGQDAVKSAKAFDDQLPLTGAILTKLDGDSRGGAVMTVRAVTGKPIRFIGVSEKMDGLEVFHSDRVAGRILGMGDVVSLVEKAQSAINEDQALELEQKLLEDEFTLEDFLQQIKAIRKMGPMQDLLKMIPGASELPLDQVNERGLDHVEAMILSMTPKERRLPEQLNMSRKRRISTGSGRGIEELNRLIKSFDQMREMVQGLKSQGMMGKAAAWKMGRDKKKAAKEQLKAVKSSRKRAKANVRRAARDMSSFRKEFNID